MPDQPPPLPPFLLHPLPDDAAAGERFAQLHEELTITDAQWPLVRSAGIAALHRLLPVAQGDTGGSGRVARFLLAC